MKHENPTVNYVPRNPLWDIFMSRANASALHIIAPPPDVFTSQHTANASVLHIITPQFIAPPRSIFTLATSSRRSSCAGLSQKAFPSRSCHYVFRRLVVNHPHAIRFFRRLASRQPHDINSDEVWLRILEQISGF